MTIVVYRPWDGPWIWGRSVPKKWQQKFGTIGKGIFSTFNISMQAFQFSSLKFVHAFELRKVYSIFVNFYLSHIPSYMSQKVTCKRLIQFLYKHGPY